MRQKKKGFSVVCADILKKEDLRSIASQLIALAEDAAYDSVDTDGKDMKQVFFAIAKAAKMFKDATGEEPDADGWIREMIRKNRKKWHHKEHTLNLIEERE